MALNLRVPEERELKPRIIVFGVGGAGGNAVNNMIDKALEGVDFVVANTDAQALSQSRAPRKIQLGVKVTEGLGAGARPEVGAAAAEEAIEEIVDHLAGSHMCFITAGMGGGTGTGAAPIIAQAARELGVLTVGVVTKPFQFEGARRMRQAEEGIEALQKVVDTLIIIPNQNLFRLANEKTTFAEAFAMADDVLYQGVKGITDLMVRPGLINLDFADVRAVMDEMGKAMMGTGEASGEDRARQAAEKAIANPLLDEISLKGARGVLINITGGQDLTLFELDEAANRIREEVDPDANIIVGSTLDPEMEGVMRVSVVATGIDASAQTEPAPRRKLAEPLPRAAREPEPEPRAEPAVARSRDEVPPAAHEAPARAPAAAEPGLFDEDLLADDELDEVEDEFASIFEEEEPEPAAPEPDVVSFPPRPAARAPEEFVAPHRPQPGTPSPETLERLRRAAQKTGSVPDPRTESRERGSGGRSRGSGFSVGSLINRMTGAGRAERETARREPTPPQVEDEPARPDPEAERIEIPAFLRRQAN
ncbi:MAG: cell division protein FtsZ [Alphaproteobacteria bacterium]|nr:MAG: cell division protein FtsZ [Alphaproteobacteria bacterium]